MEQVNVAIAGATGAVGEAMREILDERNFPIGEIRLLASERSAGKSFRVGGKSVKVEVLDDFDFPNTQIAPVLRRRIGVCGACTTCGKGRRRGDR